MFFHLFLIFTAFARKNDVTVAVDTDSVSTSGFLFRYTFDTVVQGASMYYSLTGANIQKYTADDVRNGVNSIYHGVETDSDINTHGVRVDVPLEISQTYLLWVAYGTPQDLTLMKTNIVHVPKPCPNTVGVPHSSSDCTPGAETCIATCDPGYDGGSSEFYCEVDGTWSGDLNCQHGGCPSTIPGVDNADATCADNSVGATCNVNCRAPFSGSASYVCQQDGTWSGGPLSCSQAPGPAKLECPSTIAVAHGKSTCAQTSEGSTCDVTCESGYNAQGSATFTCKNGQWAGKFSCSGGAAKFALWASGQICEPEDYEHIYFGPVTSAAECAYKVSQNKWCTNKFYTGCCGSAICACVRRGMRCELEEADEEYLGTNVYQLIGTAHPNDCLDNCGEGDDFPMGAHPGYPGTGSGGYYPGFHPHEHEEYEAGEGGYHPNGGYPSGGYPNGYHGQEHEEMDGEYGQGGHPGYPGYPGFEHDEDAYLPNGCMDMIADCKTIAASGLCGLVHGCSATCGACQSNAVTFTMAKQFAFCKSTDGGRSVIKEMNNAFGAQKCAESVDSDNECSNVFTASDSFCACVRRGETCQMDSSIHGNNVYVVSTRLQSCHTPGTLSKANTGSKSSQPTPLVYIIIILASILLISGLVYWRTRRKIGMEKENLRLDSYYTTADLDA